MQVREAMTSDVKLVDSHQSIQDAARMMAECNVGSLPVGDNGRLVGMITDRDIAIRGVAQGLSPDVLVRDLMSADPVCAYEDDDVQAIAQIMADRQVRRLPVLNREDQLVGMVSLGDLSREGKREAASEALQGVSAETTSQLQGA